MNELKKRIEQLKLVGLSANWEQLGETDHAWVSRLVQWEETTRAQRGLERRMTNAKLGRFKALSDFDWTWPKRCDQQSIHELMQLSFLNDATNVIFVGNNGVGKSTIAKNIAYQAVRAGHSALFIEAAKLLADLSSQETDKALERRLRHYAQPQLLVIDEVGYLSYGTRHADLLFEIVNRRYESKSTIVTTNRPFTEWGEVFPNASCVVSLIDRLVHYSEIIVIEGESYRMHEAQQRSSQRKKTTRSKKK